jgi:hypothetical protein
MCFVLTPAPIRGQRATPNNEAFVGSGTTWNVPDPNSIVAFEASKALPDPEFGAHRFALY